MRSTIIVLMFLGPSFCGFVPQRPGMNTRLGSTQTKNFGHYIHFEGNVLLWGKSVVRIEIHFFKSKCFQGSYSSQDADMLLVLVPQH